MVWKYKNAYVIFEKMHMSTLGGKCYCSLFSNLPSFKKVCSSFLQKMLAPPFLGPSSELCQKMFMSPFLWSLSGGAFVLSFSTKNVYKIVGFPIFG
jgi:hypothetical protein